MTSIDARSTVQISLLGGLLSIAVYGTFNTTRWMTRMETTMESLQREVPQMKDQLVAIEQTISIRLTDRWTALNMAWWADELKSRNPTLDVPDPRRHP